MSSIINHLGATFERPGFIRLAYLFMIDITNEHGSFNEHYESKYTRVGRHVAATTNSKQSKPKVFGSAIEWRHFPTRFKLMSAYSTVTTIWTIFTITKFVLIRQFGPPIDRARWLKLPLHCYLVGRFILQEDFEQIIAIMFSFGYLGWYATHLLSRPFGNNSLNFLLISQHDFELVLARLTARRQLILTADQSKNLSPSERFLLDTMSYSQPLTQGRLIYKLRPNRGREARKSLSHYFAHCFMIGCLLIGCTAFVLTILIVYSILSSETNIRHYPGCHPELERLKVLGRMPRFSLPISWQRSLEILADVIENFLIWTSCGIGCTFVPILSGLQVFDLLAYWRVIDAKVRHLQGQAESFSITINNQSSNSNEEAYHAHRSATLDLVWRRQRVASCYNLEVKALIIEMSDFFKQMAEADGHMSKSIDNAMVYCLIQCGVYTYFHQVHGLSRAPMSVILMFCYMGGCILFVCAVALSVHRHCLKTLTNICSLMAQDPMKYSSPYGALLEFFTRKRTYFTMLQRPFGATTFLTVIGWAFSCFFVITSLLQIASQRG